MLTDENRRGMMPAGLGETCVGTDRDATGGAGTATRRPRDAVPGTRTGVRRFRWRVNGMMDYRTGEGDQECMT